MVARSMRVAVVIPAFILEPRSMLERITNFFSQAGHLIDLPTGPCPAFCCCYQILAASPLGKVRAARFWFHWL